MSFIKSTLLTLTTLLTTLNTAYAVTFRVDAAGLKGNDHFNLSFGYMAEGKTDCNNANHGVGVGAARHGYEFTTPYPTPQTANMKICITAQCEDHGGIGCSYDKETKRTKPVNNSPDCMIRLFEENRDGYDWHFDYSSACG